MGQGDSFFDHSADCSIYNEMTVLLNNCLSHPTGVTGHGSSLGSKSTESFDSHVPNF